MASIYIYNEKRKQKPTVVEISEAQISQEAIEYLKEGWPKGFHGVQFQKPVNYSLETQPIACKTETEPKRIASYMMGIGDQLRKLGQSNTAYRFYHVANDIVPNLQSQLAQAQTLFDLGQIKASDTLVDQCLEKKENDPQALYLKGRMQLSLNDFMHAKKYFQLSYRQFEKQKEKSDLSITAKIYFDLTELLVLRDQLHTFDYNNQQYLEVISNIRKKAVQLLRRVNQAGNPLGHPINSKTNRQAKTHDLQGVDFTLELLIKTFERWAEELSGETIY